MVDDAELDRLMRDSLERRASDVDVTAPVARQAVAAVRRRHRGWLASGFAAASVAAVVVIVAVNSTPPPPPASNHGGPPVATDRPEPSGEWRTEYWADMKVDVPADWGWGGAPERMSGGVYFCAHPGAYLLPDGQSFVNGAPTEPYVGRPVAQSDLCIGGQDTQPRASYVWFDAAGVDPGTIDLGGGYVQETVEVNGSLLTVATDEPDLRRRILDSAGGGELCLSEIEPGGSIEHDGPLAAELKPTSMTVCAYRWRWPGERSGEAALSYAGTLGPAATNAYLSQVAQAGQPKDQCPTANIVESEWVVLEMTTDDGKVTDRHVVHFVCPGIDLSATTLRGFETITLTPELSRPWATGGIARVVYGPAGGKGAMFDSFIGTLP